MRGGILHGTIPRGWFILMGVRWIIQFQCVGLFEVGKRTPPASWKAFKI